MTLVFPTLPGIGWSVKKTPTYNTRVTEHSSGREVRVGLSARVQYQFEVQFDLDSAGYHPGIQSNSLQTLMGFFLQCNGQQQSFLYSDPTDHTVTSQSLVSGNGVATRFVLMRTIGSLTESISYVNTVSSVYVGGTLTTAYTLALPNVIVFATPPASGASIVWSGTFYFQCRFMSDSMEFQNSMSGLWSASKVQFRQIR